MAATVLDFSCILCIATCTSQSYRSSCNHYFCAQCAQQSHMLEENPKCAFCKSSCIVVRLDSPTAQASLETNVDNLFRKPMIVIVHHLEYRRQVIRQCRHYLRELSERWKLSERNLSQANESLRCEREHVEQLRRRIAEMERVARELQSATHNRNATVVCPSPSADCGRVTDSVDVVHLLNNAARQVGVPYPPKSISSPHVAQHGPRTPNSQPHYASPHVQPAPVHAPGATSQGLFQATPTHPQSVMPVNTHRARTPTYFPQIVPSTSMPNRVGTSISVHSNNSTDRNHNGQDPFVATPTSAADFAARSAQNPLGWSSTSELLRRTQPCQTNSSTPQRQAAQQSSTPRGDTPHGLPTMARSTTEQSMQASNHEHQPLRLSELMEFARSQSRELYRASTSAQANPQLGKRSGSFNEFTWRANSSEAPYARP